MKIQAAKPKYAQLKDFLLEDIREKKRNKDLSPKMPSESELIQKFGVSSTTARRALNDLAGQGLLFRVQGKGSFVEMKGSTASGNSGTRKIGIILHDTAGLADDYFLMGIINGIKELADNHDFDLILCRDNDDYLASVNENSLSGVIVMYPSFEREKPLSGLLGKHVPVVAVSSYIPSVYSGVVAADNRNGMKTVVDHLIGLGHRRIAFISPVLNRLSRIERFKGYGQALKKNKIKEDKNLLVDDIADNQEGGYASAMKLLYSRVKHPFTAIVCSNDLIAIGVMKALKGNGMRIPEDISVTGFDDIPPASFVTPPLTTMKIDIKKMGNSAFELLHSMIENKSSTRKILIPGELVVRESSGSGSPDLS